MPRTYDFVMILLLVAFLVSSVGCSKPAPSEPSVLAAEFAKFRDGTESDLKNIQVALSQLNQKTDAGIRSPDIRLLNDFLDSTEKQYSDPQAWPKLPDEVHKLSDKLEEAIVEMPATQRIQRKKQSSRLAWALEAAWYCRKQDAPGDDPLSGPELDEALGDLLERAPRNGYVLVVKDVQARLDALRKSYSDQQLGNLLSEANIAKTEADSKAALAKLELYAGNKEIDKELVRLRELVQFKQDETALKTIEDGILKAVTIEDDQALRQTLLSNAERSLLQMKAEAVLTNRTDKAYLDRIKASRDQIDGLARVYIDKETAKQKEMIRKYNEWALKQILEVDSPNGWRYNVSRNWLETHFKGLKNATEDSKFEPFQIFPSSIAFFQELTGISYDAIKEDVITAHDLRAMYQYCNTKWDFNIDSMAYHFMREAVVKHLLPIQTQYLEAPVAKLYEEAYQKCWDKLKERPSDQLHIAKKAVAVPKLLLSDPIVQGK